MDRTKWLFTEAGKKHMQERREANIARALSNPNENWMAAHLAETRIPWFRQHIHGLRIFDFWNGKKGVAVEVDGPNHDKVKDAADDKMQMERHGILVVRVRNMNEEDAARALETIRMAGKWEARRAQMGLKPLPYEPKKSRAQLKADRTARRLPPEVVTQTRAQCKASRERNRRANREAALAKEQKRRELAAVAA